MPGLKLSASRQDAEGYQTLEKRRRGLGERNRPYQVCIWFADLPTEATNEKSTDSEKSVSQVDTVDVTSKVLALNGGFPSFCY